MSEIIIVEGEYSASLGEIKVDRATGKILDPKKWNSKDIEIVRFDAAEFHDECLKDCGDYATWYDEKRDQYKYMDILCTGYFWKDKNCARHKCTNLHYEPRESDYCSVPLKGDEQNE
mgnify:CR=1 FL=1